MVNRKRNFTLHFYLMAALTTLALGAVNYLGMEYRTRVDLTADKRFTLSPGTKRLFDKLTDPINVTYYVDEEPPAKRINLERDVRDKLEELAVSSGGKLEYRVERISTKDAADKRKELEDKGITNTVDVLTTGNDERSEARGVQGYYSSIEVKYGAADPKVINGIVNLVDESDEGREHRVDTLEFDIAYAVLTMRNETRRPSFERLLKSLDKPIHMATFVSNSMPDQFKDVATNLDKALDEIAKVVPSKVIYQKTSLGPDADQSQKYPFGAGYFQLQPFQAKRELVTDADGKPTGIKITPYYAALVFQMNPDEDQFGAIWDFSDKKTTADIKQEIEDRIWDATRPRTRLGFVLPPADPRYGRGQPGQPPRNGYTPLMQFLNQTLGYDTVWVDLAGKKKIPSDLACLIVMESNTLKERELYEIERYLDQGGNVLMMVQGWSADLGGGAIDTGQVTLKKNDMDKSFEDWAKHLGVEFGQDLLLRKDSTLQPWRSGRQQAELVPSTVKFAPKIEPQDLNRSSVFTRGIAAMPLPLLIEEKVSQDRIKQLGLKQTQLVSLKGDIYKFIPKNPDVPRVPLSLNLSSPAEVERDPGAKPDKDIRAQKLDHAPLVATLLRGKFPSFWVDEKRKVPGWNGDPEKQDAQPVLNPKPGNLLLVSSAGMLNVDYFNGYSRREWQQVVVPRGINFYRNVAEAFIYGDDLVSLRARTGVAPRIVGPVDDNTKTLWFVICVAGVPLLLLLLAGARSFARTREREDYELSLDGSRNKSD